MKSLLHLMLAALLVVSAVSCVRRPKGVLSDQEMAPVVADLQLADAYLQTNVEAKSDPEARERLIEYVVRKHGLSREEFDSTMAWYGRNVDDYRNLFKKVDKELAASQRKAGGSVKAHSDAPDLWPHSRMTLISERASADGIIFNVPTPALNSGDRLEWNMRLRKPVRVMAILGVEYEGGHTTYSYKPQSNSRKINVTLQTDTGKTVKRIFGSLSVNERGDLPLWVDSIYLRTLPYDSLEYFRIKSQRLYHKPARRAKTATPTASADSSLVPRP